LAVSPLQAKRRDDVVILTNGDKMTGEVKKLSKGILYFKADYMAESVQINWAKVQRLTSSDEYNVSLANGARLKGVIEQGRSSVPEGSDFTIVAARTTMRVRPPEVVEFAPVEDTFLHQLTGSIDYGFGFTGGTDATQSSLSATATYRTEKSFTQASGTSVFNGQSGAKTSGRNTFNFDYLKSVSPRWYAGAVVDLLNSQQQDLTFRSSFGGGMARDLIHKGTTEFRMLGGLVFTREHYSLESEATPRQNNAEGILQLRLQQANVQDHAVGSCGNGFPEHHDPRSLPFRREFRPKL
jgi:hypothetical protein